MSPDLRRGSGAAPVGGAVLLAALLAGCLGPRAPVRGLAPSPAPPPIEVASLRLTAAGHMLDFRYRVIDPEGARRLLSRSAETYAVDQATGTRLVVPTTAKIGPLRQTSHGARPGRVYFALFANAGGVVRKGSLLTVVLGDLVLRDLKVE